MLWGRFRRGQVDAVRTYCQQVRTLGGNLIRVFFQVDSEHGSGWTWDDWTAIQRPYLDPACPQQLSAFFDLLAEEGLRCELTVCTYPDSEAHLLLALRLAFAVAQTKWNVLLEAGNEIVNQGIALTADLVRSKVITGSVLWSLGSYATEETEVAPNVRRVTVIGGVGRYFTFHPDRARFPRAAKETIEWRDGWEGTDEAGITRTFEGLHVPCVNDEDIGCAEQSQPGRRSTSPDDFSAAAGISCALGPGFTFHSDDGIRAQPLGPVQQQCAEAIRDNVFLVVPPIQQRGRYTRFGFADFPFTGSEADLRDYASINGNTAVGIACRRVPPDRVLEGQNGWTKTSQHGPIVVLRR